MAHIYEQTSYPSAGVWHQCPSEVPGQNPVHGGNDVNGEPLYVSRAIHRGDCIPGKFVPSHGVCYVAYDRREHSHTNYQILCNPNDCNLVWISVPPGGKLPSGAIQGGEQRDGQKLFIGRGKYQDSICIGKVLPGAEYGPDPVLYVPFGGKEQEINGDNGIGFEVLVCKEVCHLSQLNSI